MGSLASPDHDLLRRTLRELNGNFEDGQSEVVVFDDDFAYPLIAIDESKMIKPSLKHERRSEAFVQAPVKSVWESAWHSMKSHGVAAGLRNIADHSFRPTDHILARCTQKIASSLIYVWEYILSAYVILFPYALLSPTEQCTLFSNNLDWEHGVIRSFKWHPKYRKCAVALLNDDVHIYGSKDNIPLLRHPLQRKITVMDWKPNQENVIAVGCVSVVIIWNVETNSSSSRVALSCSQIVNTVPSPVTGVAFSPLGDWLAVCSSSTSKILLFPDAKDKELTVVRKWGRAVHGLEWSPDAKRLLALPLSNCARIFETKAWYSASWGSKNITDVCQAGCWSKPNGRFLLVAFKDNSTIYALTFLDRPDAKIVGGPPSFIKVLDTRELVHPDGHSVGGSVHDMRWDKHGERLAVSFKDNSEFIAVFKTKTKPTLEVELIGFIHGMPNERPLLMDFHDLFSRGSLLTVCWSSGFVSHVPLQYLPNTKTPSIGLSCSTPRSLTTVCASPSLLGSPILSPINKSRISSPRNLSFLSSDSVITPRKPTLFSRLAER